MSAMPGELVEFDNLETTLSITNFECNFGVAYLCVNVESSSDSMPRFSLSGQVIGCAPTECNGIIVESSFAFLKSPHAILENTARQSTTIFMILNIAYNSSSFDFPKILWNIAKVHRADEEGIHIENVTLSDVRLTEGPTTRTELVVTSSFDTVGFACQNIPKLFCVTLESDPRFFVTFLRTSQTVCTPLPCKGVEVTLSKLSFNSPVSVTEGSICNFFNLDFFVTFANTSATVSGANLWELVIFGSSDIKGFGNYTFHKVISINNQSLRNQDAISSTEISFTQQQVTVDLTGVKCTDFSFVCVKINRDGMSSPTFTLTGVSESARIACQNLKCTEQNIMQCNAYQQQSDCFCAQSNKSGSVKFGNLSQCYCYTSSDEKCLWLPQDCYQLYKGGVRQDGVYTIHTKRCPQMSFNVYCDMTKVDWGWTQVFQKRTHPSSVAFNRSWSEYEDGFGNFEDNFWLGNEKLCHLTQQQSYKLRVDTSHSSSIYKEFSMSCANVNYTLLDTGSFSKGTDYFLDGLSSYKNMEFNTCDRREDCECGWWCCPDCNKATNLNRGDDNGQITWGHVPVTYSEMKLKPFNK
ncbi:Tenascin-R [Holothuria leucospilota]|uniref:Tenascin-R n=1 Tax=Holothuria leucospilota TaxID=206669 RepID=A0A9Q1BU31_HOLLE|nr:Tenascin-R [Holothuria leucospilota]